MNVTVTHRVAEKTKLFPRLMHHPDDPDLVVLATGINTRTTYLIKCVVLHASVRPMYGEASYAVGELCDIHKSNLSDFHGEVCLKN